MHTCSFVVASLRRRATSVFGLLLLASTAIGAQGTHPEVGVAPPSLKSVPIRLPTNLLEAVSDLDAAKRLGKALFWEQQLGSDGMACASCHFHVGADPRVKNQINPGPQDAFGQFFSGSGGPNYTPKSCDFPFHRLAVPDDNQSAVLHDTDDRMSSAGVFRRIFSAVTAGVGFDLGTIIPDGNNFRIGNVNVRRVEPRNTPTAINSILFHRLFFDGRANFFFNGRNPFGDTDPNAKVLVKQGPQPTDPVVPTRLLFDFAAAASQAVGPPGSPFEMSYDGRNFDDIGKKMVAVRPLLLQHVAPTDSLLGDWSSAPLPGLRDPANPNLILTYSDLIKAAFHEKLWGSRQTFDGGQFTQMEKNFSLFFGLAILCYESTLVSDDSRYDQYMDGGGEGGSNSDALTAQEKEGLDIFLNRGRCIACHAGPEFAGATHTSIAADGLIERMLMADGKADGNLTLKTNPPPWDEPLEPGDLSLPIDPRGQLVEIRPPGGFGAPLAWVLGSFLTSAGTCSPPIDQELVMNAGSGAPANSNFAATVRLRVDADCSKVYRIAMSWQYPGLPAGDYTVFLAGAFVGTIHMDQVQPPAVYDNGFYNIGIRPTAEDLGNGGSGPFGPFGFAARAKAGQNVDNGLLQPPVGPNERIAVNGAFKTPSLRNIELTGPFMHNGGFATLEQVVDFYTGGAHFEVANKNDLDPEVDGIGGMNAERKAALVAFLKSLTDERVRFERAPFDHPELKVPNGHPGDENSATAGPNHSGATFEAAESFLVITAVGAEGRRSNNALRPFEEQLDPCVTLLPLSLQQQITETGSTTALARVVLSRRPGAAVTLQVRTSDTTEGLTSVASLAFTPDNWSVPQIVTVLGVQDGVADGNVNFTLIVDQSASLDPKFQGLPAVTADIRSLDSGVVYQTFQVEAESVTPTSPMVSVLDAQASGGRYVWVPNGTGNSTSSFATSGAVTYTFNVTAAGAFRLWGLVSAPTSADDSFWVKVDSGANLPWTCFSGNGAAWTWDRANDSAAQDPIVWNLTPGSHTLRIRWREDGTKLDRLILTSDPALVPATGHPVAP